MSKNILLINPSVNPESQNRVINQIISKTLPTSLGVLAGALMESNPDSVKIIDEQIDFLKDADIENLVFSLERPMIVGMSVLTINSKRAYKLCELIKNIDPNVTIILGGIHPTVMPQEALSHYGIDIVVRGEGEETLKELVETISSGTDFRRIQGISYKDNNNIIHNPLRLLVENLDVIPPFPYYLFEKNINDYSTFGAVFTSRGCPYSCIFCSSQSISNKKYRYFSIERVVSEMKILIDKYNQKMIFIMDDNISGNRNHFTRLVEGIIKNGLHKKTAFQASMRGDSINSELLDMAKSANFKMISFGLETGSDKLMKLINKGETVKQVSEAIRLTDKKGIAAAATIIFGLPTESRKDRWDTMRLVRSLPLSSIRFNTLVPYPGTPIFEMLDRYNQIDIRKDWENFAVQYMWEGDSLPYVPKGNTNYELMFDTMFANLSYYLSINGIRRMFKSSFAGGNVIFLRKAWYLSPQTIFKLLEAFFYLIKRFLYVAFKMLLKR